MQTNSNTIELTFYFAQCWQELGHSEHNETETTYRRRYSETYFFHEIVWILIKKFVPNGPINNIPALV